MTAPTGRSPVADEVVAELLGDAAGIRACAVVDRAGEVVAASAGNDWAAQADRLWEAAADPERAAPAYVHVAIETGEVFAVRSERFSVIAIADRFTLASLMLCDLRAALRRLEAVAA